LRFTHGYLTPGPVTSVEPPRLLEYAWEHAGTLTGRVRFDLTDQQPIGCRLELLFAALNGPLPLLAV
jgi:uncharacterized protein YndB with AHSA1/START domain